MGNWLAGVVMSSWFPVVWISAWIGGGSLCLMIRNRIILRPGRRPPYELFPVPPTCYFRLARCVDGQVQDIFIGRLENDRFWKKAERVFMTLSSESIERIRSASEILFQRLMLVLGDAEFYTIVPWWFPTVVGYAALSGPNGKEVILGLDPWGIRIPGFGKSAADHELLHCIQHVCHDTFNMEWGGRIPGRFFYEWQATWVGTPFIAVSLIFLVMWPLLLYVPIVF